MSLSIQMKDIAASLWCNPATFEELCKREFLLNTSIYGIDYMLYEMQKKDWIYEKNGAYYTYKKFAQSEDMSEFDLDDKVRKWKGKYELEFCDKVIELSESVNSFLKRIKRYAK